MSEVVGVDPEGLAALLTFMRLLPRVLQLVGLESLEDDEALAAYVAGERSLPRVASQMVVVRGFVEERLPTCAAAVGHQACVDRLVPLQQTLRVEALAAGLAAERSHVHGGPVPSIDDSAATPLQAPPADDLPVSVIVSDLLVFLQLAVVQKCLSAQIAHEGLGRTVKKHVGLELVVLSESHATDLTFERFLPRVNANVSLQVVLQRETRPARLARKRFPSVDRLVCPQRPPLYKSLSAHGALVGMLPCVHAPVALQREGVPEALAAVGAPVRLLGGVHDLMGLQVVFGLEALPAGGAGEWPPVRVHELMSLQVHLCSERLVAEAALEGGKLLLLVPQQVVLERGRVPELPGALVADVRSLVSVRVLVLHQVISTVKTLVANITDKLSFLLGFCFLCVCWGNGLCST